MSQRKWLCPYCDTEYRSTLFVKHLFSKHFNQLFDPETEWGKKNLFTYSVPRKNCIPLSIELPSERKCPDFEICLGCMTGCSKHGSILKHFEKPLNHSERHLAKAEEIRLKVEEIKTGKRTPSVPVNSIVVPEAEVPTTDSTGVQKLLWTLIKKLYSAEARGNRQERHLEAIQEHYESRETMDKEEFEDYEPMGEMNVFLHEPAWGLYDLPFPKDITHLIHKFEKGEYVDTWLDRLDPSKIRDQKKPQQKKVVAKPEPKPEPPKPEQSKPDPPKPEPPKQSPPPLASSYYQALRPAPVAPALPSIIQTTKR